MDEILLKQQQETQNYEISKLHPLVSSVIYLDDGGTSAAPTLVIDEVNIYFFYFNFNFLILILLEFIR